MLVGMETLIHLRFTMNLKVRCECKLSSEHKYQDTWHRSPGLVITTLLEITLVWNQAMASWRKTTFYVFSFLEQISRLLMDSVSRLLPPLFLVPLTSDVSIHLGMFGFCLNLSENLPSELISKPLRKAQESKNSDMFEVFSNISCRAFLSDLCSSW